jgi:hypothetical protein
MRNVLITGACFVGSLVCGVAVLSSAQKTKSPPAVHAPFHGQVVVKQKTSLTTFSKPVLTPPRLMPPPVQGKAWRWHRNHGWIAVDANAEPVGILLSETYVLPATVQLYETQQIVVSGSQIVCPHCGQIIIIRK